MEAVIYGICTSHAPGKFCKRLVCPNWFVSCFTTPFVYEMDGKMLEGSAGDMLIMPPGTPVYHGPLPDAKEGFTNDWIYLRGDELEKMLTRYPLPVNTAFSVGRKGFLRQYLENVRRENTARLPGYRDQLLYLTGQLVIDLYRAFRRDRDDPRARLEKAREAVMRSPEKQWTLSEMAQLSGYSVSRFSSLYKEQFGLSPKQDLLSFRLETACRMLKYTGATVSEVSEACGFQTIYYFSKYFKAVKGMSPREYAEKD